MQDYEKTEKLEVGQVPQAAKEEGEPVGPSHFWQGWGWAWEGTG